MSDTSFSNEVISQSHFYDRCWPKRSLNLRRGPLSSARKKTGIQMKQAEYTTMPKLPSVEEYLHLRAVAGLSAFSEDAARAGLPGTVYSVMVMRDGVAVGMGRLIGDGGCFFQVVDIAVHPDHQGRGLGKTIMDAIMTYVSKELPTTAYVSLIADVPANKLYEKFGFLETAPRSLGMAFRVKR